jgi:hypothetical protein
MRPIVFLHVPKTAGQTIHTQLKTLVGGIDAVSPIRVHTQGTPAEQMTPGYRLYSGHLDWTHIGQLPADRFVFTVLRDPRERIGSFYEFVRSQAQNLAAEEREQPRHLGKKRALELSADAYFFGGDAQWQAFIHDHYWNFYAIYFASRMMRGHRKVAGLAPEALIDLASKNLESLQGVYSTESLDALERDLAMEFGFVVRLTKTFVNVGDRASRDARWDKLLSRFERSESIARLEDFVALDEKLMSQIFAKSDASARSWT